MEQRNDQNRIDAMRLVDAACDRFEESFHTETPIAIEELLNEYPPEYRHDILLEAIRVETELRRERGETPKSTDYLSRFPDASDAIETLLSNPFSNPLLTSEQETISRDVGESRLDGIQDDESFVEPKSLAASAPVANLAVGQSIGRYRIEKLLGRGGMGLVYLATDTRLNRPVALKLPRIVDDADLIQRFEREARSMASVSHRNLCSIHDVDEVAGIRFLTMEYIDGETLSDRIAKGAPYTQVEAAVLIQKMAMATEFAHRAGVIHRDLKPSNVIIDRENEPVIMDFGLAQRANEDDARLTKAGGFVGTPLYMAPEQTLEDDAQVGPWSDVYSLGAILYELLTGRTVYIGKTASIISQLVAASPAIPPKELRPYTHTTLNDICMRAIAPQRADRYPTAKQFADALAHYISEPLAEQDVNATGRFESIETQVFHRPAFTTDQSVPIENPNEQHERFSNTSPKRTALIASAFVALVCLAIGIVARFSATSEDKSKMETSLPLDQQTRDPSKQGNVAELIANGPAESQNTSFGKSLQLRPDAFVSIDKLTIPRDGVHTIEAFVVCGTDGNGTDRHIVGWPGMSSMFLRSRSIAWAFGLDFEQDFRTAMSPKSIAMLERTHLAAVRDENEMRLYVNGVLQEKTPIENAQLRVTQGPFSISTSGRSSPFTGLFDEIRVSNSVRYTQNFSVPQTPFETDSNTIGLYHCDEGDGLVLQDASGNENHGVIVGAEWIDANAIAKYRPPIDDSSATTSLPLDSVHPKLAPRLMADQPDGYSLVFDGATSYIEVPDINRDEPSPLTFEMWVKPQLQSTARALAVLSGQRFVQLGKSSTTLFFMEPLTPLSNSRFNPRFIPGEWSHIAVVANDRECKFFSNGVLVNQLAVSDQHWHKDYPFRGLWIGAHPANGIIRYFYAGQIDEIRVSNIERYTSSFSPATRFEPDEYTVALFHCDDGDGTTLTDASIHGHHGTAYGVHWEQYVESEPTDRPKALVAPLEPSEAMHVQSEWSNHMKTPTEEINSIGMAMRLIPPGKFLMGASIYDLEAQPTELPQHSVTITKPFRLSATEVTIEQFREFIEATGYVTQAESDSLGAFDNSPKVRISTMTWSTKQHAAHEKNLPVTCVSYSDVESFCKWLGEREQCVYRLPTEAEWEYACRAGTQTIYSFGDTFDAEQANATRTNPWTRLPVKSFAANSFGLFDMHGNVHEWCLDSGRVYTSAPETDPVGPQSNTAIVRGGAGGSPASRLRSSHRYLNDQRQFPETDFANISKGFRVLKEMVASESSHSQ